MLTDKEDIDHNKMLILYKTFEHIDPLSIGGLKIPTNWQINVCRISLKMFENHFQNKKSEVKIVSIMKKIIITKLNKNMPDFKNFPCKQHVDYMINLLLTIRIFNECKWQKKNRYITRLKRFQNYEYLNISKQYIFYFIFVNLPINTIL